MTKEPKSYTPLARLRDTATGPVLCGQTPIGGGIFWPTYLEKIAISARGNVPLDAATEEAIETALVRFDRDFRTIATPEINPTVARAFADLAFIMSFGTPESLAELRSAMGRGAGPRKHPVSDAINEAFDALGNDAKGPPVQKYIKAHHPEIGYVSPRLIYNCRKNRQ